MLRCRAVRGLSAHGQDAGRERSAGEGSVAEESDVGVGQSREASAGGKGRVDAIVVQNNAGATTTYSYAIHLVPAGDPIDAPAIDTLRGCLLYTSDAADDVYQV